MPTPRFALALIALASLLALEGCPAAGSSDGDRKKGGPPPVLVPAPRPPVRTVSMADGTCDGGLLDFGKEFHVAGARRVGLTYPDPDTVELDLEVDLKNVGGAHFRSASLLPDLAALADLGVATSPAPLPADFGEIAPGATVTSGAPLRLRVPLANLPALEARLRGGTVALSVQGDEVNEVAPGVRVLSWSGNDDALYQNAVLLGAGFGAPINPDPGAGPFTPGQEFGIALLEPRVKDFPTVLDQWTPGAPFYLVEDPGQPLAHIPEPFRGVRVVDAQKQDPGIQDFTLWLVTLKLTNDESIPASYTTASHCTGRRDFIDPDVQASRAYQLDGVDLPTESVDIHSQPVRMNGLVLGKGPVTFHGQLSGHVLKPSLTFRVRNGKVELGGAVDNELSIMAEIILGETAEVAPDKAKLYSLCFPLPDLNFGFIHSQQSLLLESILGAEWDLGASFAASFNQTLKVGVKMTCQAGLSSAPSCEHDFYSDATDDPFTPPHIVESSGFGFRAEVTFHNLLHVGDRKCLSGVGLALDATGYVTAAETPFADPWWSMKAGVDLTGIVQFDIEGLDISKYQTTLYTTEKTSRSSFTHPSPPGEPVGSRTSGNDQRWSVVLDDTTVPNGVSKAKVAALPDGSAVVVATEPVGGRNPVLRLDPKGALVWVKELARKAVKIRTLPDGSVVVVGQTAALARLDGDGNLLWSWEGSFVPAGGGLGSCVLADVAPIELSPGVYDYVGVGVMADNDGCAFRVRADGSVAWSQVYVGDGQQLINAAVPTRDGMVAMVSKDLWVYQFGFRIVPLVAKLDPADGTLVWAKKLPVLRFATFADVVEAADGTLFAVGNAAGTIYSTGAAFISRISGDGTEVHHAVYYEDATWEALFDSSSASGPYLYAPYADTAGGNTAYDTLEAITASGGGFVAVGGTGLSPTAAWAVKVTPKLGTEWMTVVDGPDGDWLTGVAATAQGLFVAGYTRSLDTAPGVLENQLWVSKLPHTGRLELPGSLGFTTRYIADGVRDTSGDPSLNPVGALLDATLTLAPPVQASSGPSPGLVVAASPYCIRLLTETGTATPSMACPYP